MNDKPVFEIDVKSVINLHSPFKEKLLCDGITFSAGTACAYSCQFCYVENQHVLNSPVQKILSDNNAEFDEIIIRRRNAVGRVREILTKADGTPRFHDPKDTRVIFGSPLVDVAPNMVLVNETIAICREILKLTHWHIRLLSKSNLLPKIAEALADHKDRLIFGVSTGTLNNALASAFECGTPLASKRIESLRWLQDNGFRTYGMLCPSLPQDEAIRVNRCEHVWAEVMNVRGAGLNKTILALQSGGFAKEAIELAGVCGVGAAKRWEAYARATFLALTKVIPADKLRFLQYVQPTSLEFWKERQHQGAILLGKAADKDANL
jgi:DNA repair photolyase